MANPNASLVAINSAQVGDTGKPFVGYDGTNLVVHVPTGGAVQTQVNGVTVSTLSATGTVGAAGSTSLADKGTATGASLAVTLSKQTGTVTTESLTTAAGADVAYVVTNTLVSATSVVVAQVAGGTNTTVPAYVHKVVPASGSFTVSIRNGHASAALNGTLVFVFAILA